MKEVDYGKIGERIKQFRSKKGLSQEQLGLLVIADSKHISHIEQGNRRPSLEILIHIANALDTSADDLLVDSLDHTAAKDELHELLADCSETEKAILIKTLKFTKELFSEFGI